MDPVGWGTDATCVSGAGLGDCRVEVRVAGSLARGVTRASNVRATDDAAPAHGEPRRAGGDSSRTLFSRSHMDRALGVQPPVARAGVPNSPRGPKTGRVVFPAMPTGSLALVDIGRVRHTPRWPWSVARPWPAPSGQTMPPLVSCVTACSGSVVLIDDW